MNPLSIALKDEDADRVRRSHAQAIEELQRLQPTFVTVELEDGKPTSVKHGRGRIPKFVGTSAVRGAVSAGYINEIRSGVDRTKTVVLQADDYGATVTVEVMVL